MIGYGLGFRRDTHATHDGDARAYLDSLPPPTEGSVRQPISFLEQVGGVLDQRQTSTCVGQAAKRAVDLRAAALGLTIPSGSATAARNLALEIEARLDGRAGAPLEDVGCEPSLLVQALRTYGVPSETSCPFGPDTLTKRLTLAELEDADKRLPVFVRAFRGITSTGAQRLEDVTAALGQGFPVMLAICASTSAFQQCGPDDVLTAWASSKGTDHMVQLVEYTATGFTLCNSWGPSWGRGGLASVDAGLVAAADHLFIVDLSSTPEGATP